MKTLTKIKSFASRVSRLAFSLALTIGLAGSVLAVPVAEVTHEGVTAQYDSLTNAVKAAAANDTVTLLADTALAETLTITNAITLDLGNHEVTLAAAGDGIKVTAAATVQNGALKSQRTVNSVDTAAAGVDAVRAVATSATFKNLTIDAAHYRMGLATDCGDVASLAYVYVNNPTAVVTCQNVDVTGNGTLFYGEFAELSLDKDCSAIAQGTPFSYAAAIYSAGHATVDIDRGTYSNTLALLSGNLGGKIVVDGGTFYGDVKSWMEVGAHTELEQYDTYKAVFNLKNGIYKGAVVFQDPSDAARKLDSFTKGRDIILAAPAGYCWFGNTTLGKLSDAACMIVTYGGMTTNYYATLAEVADVGGKITLLKNASADGIKLTEAATLDLNGQTLTIAAAFTNAADLVITNALATGGLDVSGNIRVEAGVLNLDALAYGEGGLLQQKGGSITITKDGSVKFMKAWDNESANALNAYTPGFFKDTENDAKVITGKTYTWNGTMFDVDGAVAKAEIKNGTFEYVESYKSPEAAVAAAKVGGTVTLLCSYLPDATLTIDKAITFDLGGKDLYLPKTGDGVKLTAAATVQNGTLKSLLKADAAVYALHSYKTSAVYSNLTVNAAHYRFAVYAEGADAVADCYGSNDPTTTVNCYNVDVTGNGTLFEAEFTKMNLDADCSATADGTAWNYAAAIYSAGNATITVAGGTYMHEKALLSGNLGGKIVVNGGTFDGQVYSWMESTAHPELNDDPKYQAQFTLNAGTFSDAWIAFKEDSDAARKLDSFVKGADVEIDAPVNFFWKGGTTLAKVVATIGTTEYASLNDAIEAAKAGETVSVVAPAGDG